jgi:hypothetical protein
LETDENWSDIIVKSSTFNEIPDSLQTAIHIEIGDVCCAIKCNDRALLGDLQRLYGNFQSQKAPDINIELEVIGERTLSEINSALPGIRIKRENQSFTADALALESDISEHSFRMKVERAFFDPGAEFKLWNRILPLAYYTVCHRKYDGLPPAMLVHFSAVLRRGKVLLFVAPSGTGKTTIARLCSGEWSEVLNDEMTLLSHYIAGIGITVRGIPILGGLPQRLNTGAALKCVFCLKQSKQTLVRRLTKVEAYLRFIRQIISPAYAGLSDKKALFGQIADFAEEVTGTVPFYELEFSLDRGRLLQVMEDLEQTMEKEEQQSGKPC